MADLWSRNHCPSLCGGGGEAEWPSRQSLDLEADVNLCGVRIKRQSSAHAVAVARESGGAIHAPLGSVLRTFAAIEVTAGLTLSGYLPFLCIPPSPTSERHRDHR